MRWVPGSTGFAIAAVLLAVALGAPAARGAEGERLEARRAAFRAEVARGGSLHADRQSFDAAKSRAVLAGNVHFESATGKIQVFADGAVAWGEFDALGNPVSLAEIYAEGDVLLFVFGDSFEADWLFLDLVAGEGRLERATARSSGGLTRGIPILARAERARVADDLTTFSGENALVSTCTFERPHYALTAREVRVERVAVEEIGRVEELEVSTARIAIERPRLEVFGTPVLAFPFTLHWDTAWNPFVPRVRVGRNRRFGAFALTEVPLYPGEALDLAAKVDFLERRGVGVGGTAGWQGPAGDRQTYMGFLDGLYLSDRAREDSDGTAVPQRDRYRIRAFHRDDLPWGFRREAEVSHISDRGFLREYYEQEFKTGKEQETALYGRWLGGDMGATLIGRWRLNEFQTQVEYLPRGRWSWIGEPFLESVLPGGRGIYLTTAWELANARRQFDEDTLLPSRRLLRADLENRLDWPFPAGPVQVDPFVLGRYSAWSEGAADDESLDRLVAGGGAIATTDLWRDFGGLRHIVTPSVGYVNVFYNETDPAALVEIDSVETVTESESIPFGIRNRLEDYRPAAGAFVNAIDWNVTARFFPRPGADNAGERFGTLRSDLRLSPAAALGARWRSDWDPNPEGGLFRSDADVLFRPYTNIILTGGHRFFENTYQAVSAAVDLGLSERWSLRASAQYDFERSTFTDQRFAIRRYLHRFVLEFAIDADFGEHDVRFAVNFMPLEVFESRVPFGGEIQRGLDPLF